MQLQIKHNEESVLIKHMVFKLQMLLHQKKLSSKLINVIILPFCQTSGSLLERKIQFIHNFELKIAENNFFLYIYIQKFTKNSLIIFIYLFNVIN